MALNFERLYASCQVHPLHGKFNVNFVPKLGQNLLGSDAVLISSVPLKMRALLVNKDFIWEDVRSRFFAETVSVVEQLERRRILLLYRLLWV